MINLPIKIKGTAKTPEMEFRSQPNWLDSYYSFETLDCVLNSSSRSHIGNFVGKSAHEAIRKAISAGRQVYTFRNGSELLKHEKIMLRPTPASKLKK